MIASLVLSNTECIERWLELGQFDVDGEAREVADRHELAAGIAGKSMSECLSQLDEGEEDQEA